MIFYLKKQQIEKSNSLAGNIYKNMFYILKLNSLITVVKKCLKKIFTPNTNNLL